MHFERYIWLCWIEWGVRNGFISSFEWGIHSIEARSCTSLSVSSTAHVISSHLWTNGVSSIFTILITYLLIPCGVSDNTWIMNWPWWAVSPHVFMRSSSYVRWYFWNGYRPLHLTRSLACIIYIICGIAGCLTKFSSSFVQRAPTGRVGHR